MSLYSEVKTLVDEPGSGVFWADAQVYDAINEAQIEVYATTKWALTTATITCTASAEQATVPLTLMIPQFFLNTSGRLPTTSFAQLENYSRLWRRANADVPKHFVKFGFDRVRPFPLAASTTTFQLVGVSWPAQIEDGTLDITAPRLIKQAIIHRAASFLLEMTLPDLAAVLEKQSIEYEQQALVQLRNAQSHNINRLRPANHFQALQGGDVRFGRRYL